MYKYGAEECKLLLLKKVATELLQGVPGANNQDDTAVKTVTHTKTTEDNGPGSKNIPMEGLNNNSLWFHPITKGDTIPRGVHRMRGPSGKTLPWTDMS